MPDITINKSTTNNRSKSIDPNMKKIAKLP